MRKVWNEKTIAFILTDAIHFNNVMTEQLNRSQLLSMVLTNVLKTTDPLSKE
jgi:hypothetical protein